MNEATSNNPAAAPDSSPRSAFLPGAVTMFDFLEALAEAVVIIDQTGSIVHVNHRAGEMFGYQAAELRGQPLGIILPERFVAQHTQHVSRFFQHPRRRSISHNLELNGKRRDGTEIPLDISLSYLNVENRLLALAFLTDATHRKQVERDLRIRNEQLDAFAHTVAHDLNSSLAVVVGFSEQLLEIGDTLSADELRTYLGAVARSGRKMNSIINELLLFASIRKEEVPVDRLDMAAIVKEAVQRLRDALERQQAVLLLPEAYPSALGYAPWVEEVWYNYLSNAIKYGGRPPHIELGGQLLGNGQVRFWVKDDGPGLPAGQQARLFTMYGQLDHPQIKGHGLGLSIVHQIVDKLGGQVGVESEGVPSQGSTFFFTLPSAGQ